MKIVKLIARILIFILFTVLTQIGGIVYLISFSGDRFINKKFHKKISRRAMQFSFFLALYAIATFLIVPLLAKPFGRVPLPLTASENFQPLNFITCILNRHYVRPELKQTALQVAKEMSTKFPGTTISYLDANFPLINNFPLFPHLSHNDGKKLDIAFCYNDKATGQPVNGAPSIIGYGVNEEPLASEVNMISVCAEKNWQYSFMSGIIPQGNKSDFIFDSRRTKELVNLFASKPSIGKIFIEPHLKARLQLSSEKVRFHGCQAVRHDDHIHVQLN